MSKEFTTHRIGGSHYNLCFYWVCTYKLVFGQDCTLPVELKAVIWAGIAWEKVRTLEDLLVTCPEQLERKGKDIRTAQESIRRSRLRNKAQFDKVQHRRKELLRVGNMVLLHNTVLNTQWLKKLDNHWLGPYLIRETRPDWGTYLLSQLDGAKLNAVFTGNSLTNSFQREGIELDEAENAAESGPEEEVKEETDDEQVD